MPNRGASASLGQMKFVSEIPSPWRIRPLVGLPVFGTSVPMASVEFGPRNCPVRGFRAWRLAPEQGNTPFAQPATYNTGASDWLHRSGKKFEACPMMSCGGCWWTRRRP
jgi:hypothetical protein